MLRVTLLLLTVIGVLFATATARPQNQQCPVNQEWTNCGTACPPTCNSPDPYRPCTLQCVIGCQCKQGYLYNNAGNCVTSEGC